MIYTIGPGVYNESVTVTTSYLTLRGTDRNKVIVDGQFMSENGIQIYETDGVTVDLSYLDEVVPR